MRQDFAARTSRYTRVVERLDQRRDNGSDDSLIPLGFPGIDRMIGGGVHAGELIIIAGDCGSGTSSLLTAIALRSAALQASRDSSREHTADDDLNTLPRVLIMTGELPLDRAYARVLGIASRVPSSALRAGEIDDISRARLSATAGDLRESGPIIELLEGGPAAVSATLDRMRSVQLVLLDGLEGLHDAARSTGLDRDDALAEVILSLKRLAITHDVALVATAHLPQTIRDRNDRRPRLSDLGARGAVGVHADVVLGVFREELYERDHGVAGAAEVILLKHREMPPAYADLYFDAELLLFEDVMDPDR